MTTAQYWHQVCRARSTRPLIDDPVSRSILADAACAVHTTGYNGRMWVFADQSRILVTTETEVVK
jgi:hypothetical protein